MYVKGPRVWKLTDRASGGNVKSEARRDWLELRNASDFIAHVTWHGQKRIVIDRSGPCGDSANFQ